MIKYNFYEKCALFLFYINKKIKILTKQNGKTIVKFLYFSIKFFKHFD